MSIRVLLAVTLVAVAAAGCSSSGSTTAPQAEPSADALQAEPSPAVAEPLAWGETGTVIGENGTPVEITPVGITYLAAEAFTDEFYAPYEGYYVAVAVDAQAVEGEETLGYVGAGTGLVWRVGGQTVTAIDGNATSAPWVGGVPSFDNSVVLLPGEEPTRGIEQFDIPEPGGHLTYLNPDGSMVRWEAPTEDTGGGLDDVTAE